MHIPFLQQDDIIQALGWTLLHSLWQGLLLALLAGLVMLLTKHTRAGVRYSLLVSLFCLFLGATVFTFISQWRHTAVAAPAGIAATTAAVYAAPDDEATLPAFGNQLQASNYRVTDRFVSYFNTHAALVVLIWFVVFSARLAKLLVNLAYVQRVRRHKTHAPPARWKQQMRQMAEGLSIRVPVRLLESEVVNVPLVIGFFKPVILIPLGLVTHLPSEQVEAVLLHELAHIKRRDYLVNLLQSFAETIFFFNPAVLWLSSLIRDERENCCDDIAIAGTENKATFLAALVSFQEYNSGVVKYGMAFPGRKNHLLNRVKRILHQKNKTLNTMEKSMLTFSVVIILLLTLATTRQAHAQTDTMRVKENQEMMPPAAPAAPLPVPVAPAAKAIAPKPAPAAAVAEARVPAVVAVPAPPPPPAPAAPLPAVAVTAVTPVPAAAPVPQPSSDTLNPPAPPLPPEKPVERNFSRVSVSTTNDGKTKTESIEATEKGGKTYRLNRLNGVITGIFVDGVEIPKEQYNDYQWLVYKLDDSGGNTERKIQLRLKQDQIRIETKLRVDSIQLKKWVSRNVIQKARKPIVYYNNISVADVPAKKYDFQYKGVGYEKPFAPLFTARIKARAPSVKVIRPTVTVKPLAVRKQVLVQRNDGADIQQKKELFRSLISDMKKENLVQTPPGVLSFGLSDKELIINGVKQPDSIQEKYKQKYLSQPGLGFYYGPVKMTGKGYFMGKEDLAQ